MTLFIKDPHILHNVQGVSIDEKTMYDEHFPNKKIGIHDKRIDEMARERFYRKTK